MSARLKRQFVPTICIILVVLLGSVVWGQVSGTPTPIPVSPYSRQLIRLPDQTSWREALDISATTQTATVIGSVSYTGCMWPGTYQETSVVAPATSGLTITAIHAALFPPDQNTITINLEDRTNLNAAGTAVLAGPVTLTGEMQTWTSFAHAELAAGHHLVAVAPPNESDRDPLSRTFVLSIEYRGQASLGVGASGYLEPNDIGATVQGYDPNLTAIAAIAGGNGNLYRNSNGNWGLDANTYALSSHNHSGVYQPLDSGLTSIAALSTQTFGRSLLTQASAAATRSTLELGTTYTVYTAGSRPVVTASEAAMDWVDAGNVDPNLTLASAGTYLVQCKVQLDLVGATFAANRTVTIKLVRRNNTPAAIDNGTVTAITPVVTTATQSWINLNWSVIYTTANTNDQLGLNWLVDVVPSAGTLKAREGSIIAYRIQ